MTPKKGGSKYAMKVKKKNNVYLQTVTMIEPSIGWIDICALLEARTDLVANQIEFAWLTR